MASHSVKIGSTGLCNPPARPHHQQQRIIHLLRKTLTLEAKEHLTMEYQVGYETAPSELGSVYIIKS
jgi:hypothetical protein